MGRRLAPLRGAFLGFINNGDTMITVRRYAVEREAKGRNGIHYNVVDTWESSAIVKTFKATAPLDPASNEKAMKRAADHRDRLDSAQRIKDGQEEIKKIVATGKCPHCGERLRRNMSMTGWWQCDQLGAENFRVRPNDPPCNWQGFTE